MPSPTFVAFIDESGCDGDAFGKGSSDFLILSAAVGVDIFEGDLRMQLSFARDAILAGDKRKPKDWQIPKFDKANGPVQWVVCERMTEVMFNAAHVLIHKPSIKDEKLRKDRNRLYRYASKLLVERISWICDAQHHPLAGGDGTCRIVFSQDLSRSYKLFREYLSLLSAQRERIATSIKWQHISPELVEDRPFKSDLGLLLADYHASALGLAAQKTKFGQFDDRYARVLGEKILKNPTGSSAFGYGYKFWPKEAERLYHDPQFSWMKRV